MEAAVLKKRGWLVEIGKNLEKYRQEWVEIGVMVYRPLDFRSQILKV